MKKNNNGRAKNGGDRQKEQQIITDPRFASVQSDPRFMEAPKKRSKVEIDSRFSRVFTDRRFTSSNARIDKRGKPKNNNKGASSLSHYYRLEQQEDEKEVSPIKEEENANGVAPTNEDSHAESDRIGDDTESESEKLNDGHEDSDDDGQSLDESSSTSTTDTDSDDDQYIDGDEEEDTFLQPVRILFISLYLVWLHEVVLIPIRTTRRTTAFSEL